MTKWRTEMRTRMCKLLTLCVASLFATHSAFSECCPPPKPVDPCCRPSVGHELLDCQGIMGAYNAPASIDVKDCWKVFLTADFLYWQAREDNLAYGVTSDGAIGDFISNGKVLNMDFKWHPGVKVGLGVNFPRHDNWDLFLEWTHLVSHNNTSHTAPVQALGASQDYVYPSLSQPSLVSATEAGIAKASWRLVYNTIDLNLGRPYYSGKMLTFRPHVGLRGAWFRQHINISYNNIFADAPDTRNVMDSTKFDSWSIGPRFGLESNWILGAGFRVFGEAAFSLLYTYFDVFKTDTRLSTAPGISVTSDVKDSDRYSQVRPNTEAALGFGWGSYFGCNSWHLDLSAGYEFQYWINANSNIQFVDDIARGVFVSGGDLALHGATFRLRLDF